MSNSEFNGPEKKFDEEDIIKNELNKVNGAEVSKIEDSKSHGEAA